MKKLIVLFSILICGNLFAQPTFVKATSQGWAGGVCCRTGVNYVITIKGTKKEMEKITVNSVCIGNRKYNSPAATLSHTQSDTLSYLTIRCGFSQDGYTERNPGDQLNEVKYESCNDLCVIYTLGKAQNKISITKVEELFYIAYP